MMTRFNSLQAIAFSLLFPNFLAGCTGSDTLNPPQEDEGKEDVALGEVSYLDIERVASGFVDLLNAESEKTEADALLKRGVEYLKSQSVVKDAEYIEEGDPHVYVLFKNGAYYFWNIIDEGPEVLDTGIADSEPELSPPTRKDSYRLSTFENALAQ